MAESSDFGMWVVVLVSVEDSFDSTDYEYGFDPARETDESHYEVDRGSDSGSGEGNY